MEVLLPHNFYRLLFFLHLALLLAAAVQVYRCRETRFHKAILLLIAGMLPILGSLIVLVTVPVKKP